MFEFGFVAFFSHFFHTCFEWRRFNSSQPNSLSGTSMRNSWWHEAHYRAISLGAVKSRRIALEDLQRSKKRFQFRKQLKIKAKIIVLFVVAIKWVGKTIVQGLGTNPQLKNKETTVKSISKNSKSQLRKQVLIYYISYIYLCLKHWKKNSNNKIIRNS